jgi:excisionase family DNA binding protein
VKGGVSLFHLEERMGESKTPHEKPVNGELITAKEASKYIHVGLTTLYYGVRCGKIPFFRPPVGKILFDTAQLDEYMRVSNISTGTAPGNT